MLISVHYDTSLYTLLSYMVKHMRRSRKFRQIFFTSSKIQKRATYGHPLRSNWTKGGPIVSQMGIHSRFSKEICSVFRFYNSWGSRPPVPPPTSGSAHVTEFQGTQHRDRCCLYNLPSLPFTGSQCFCKKKNIHKYT